jgi:hypothetical protein
MESTPYVCTLCGQTRELMRIRRSKAFSMPDGSKRATRCCTDCFLTYGNTTEHVDAALYAAAAADMATRRGAS